MKTNVGLNSVHSLCCDETSRVEKNGEKEHEEWIPELPLEDC